ncbi:MAG: phosphoserine phosphatase SerB [Acholeplasmataceae bacterium]
MIKLVVFDLDNVIINGEGIDEIGKLANVQDKIAEITEQAMNGDIDFETSINERVKLLEGASVEEIKKIAEELPLNNGAEETIKALKDKGYEIAIISGSFDVIADSIKDKLNIDYLFTNSLSEEDGKLTGEVTGPLVSGSKLDVLSDLLKEKDYDLADCIAVGDGANDISMLEGVGYGIAFNAKPKVKEIADVIVEDNDLNDVLTVIEDLDSKAEDGEDTSSKAETKEPEESEESEEVKEVKDSKAEDGEDTSSKKEAKDSKKSKKSKKSKLPEPTNFVLADTMDGVKVQKDEKEKLISQIADEREAFNKEAKEQRKIRDELNNSLKENLQKAIEYRDSRNEINKDVEANKKKRNDVNEKIKNLEWSSGKRDKVKLENEIKKIDKIIETRVLDIKKENQLVKNANDLRKQLTEVKEDDKVKDEAQELKKESELYHANVVEHSAKAQEAHENMLKYFRKTDEIRTAADEAHKNFIQARKNASAKHEDFKMVLSEIHVINKKLGRNNKPKRQKSNNKGSSPNKRNKEEKEKAEVIFDKFKHGKKLSTEELLLLQKYDIS